MTEPPPPPPPPPFQRPMEQTDSTSTGGFNPQSRGSTPSQHPPRPTATYGGSLNRKVSFSEQQPLKKPVREPSYETLDGEGLLTEENDFEDHRTLPASNKSPLITSVSYHDRQASLDGFSLGMGSAPGSPTPFRRKSFIDVKAVNPLESEAEMLIMKALDRQDQDQGLMLTNISLLGNVPDKAAAVFRSNDSASTPSVATGAPRRDLPPLERPRPINRRGKTTESSLADLTDALTGLHNDIDADSLKQKEDTIAVIANGPAAENLVKTAQRIYSLKHRTQSVARMEDLNDIASRRSTGDGSTTGKSNAEKMLKAKSTPHSIGSDHLAVTINETLDSPDSDSHKKTDGDVKQPDVELGSNSPCGGDPLDTSDSNVGLDGGFGGLTKKRKKHSRFDQAQPGVIRDFQIFFGQRRSGFLSYLRFLFLVIFPSVAVAFFLYYVGGNPPYGKIDLEKSTGEILLDENGDLIDPNDTSISWWILFVGVRQALIFSLAQLIQVFFIDFLCLNTRCFVQLFGNLVTLLIVQSKGWPFLCLCWASFSFGLLHGKHRFSNHWLYWQDGLGIFNERNPGGSATVSIWYTRILIITISISVLVAVKRLVVGLYLGKQTYINYAVSLTKTVKKVLLLTEVAALARQCLVDSMSQKDISRPKTISERISTEQLRGLLTTDTASQDEADLNNSRRGLGLPVDGQNLMQSSDRTKIRDLLGDWEDPDPDEQNQDGAVTISSILQFRQSLSLLNTSFIFSIAWGDVSTREDMVISSEEVYRQLMFRSPKPNVLTFDVLASICKCRGKLDQAKLKELIRLLRPDRSGDLTLLDFIKSVDTVYKEVKLLRATIKNSEKIDLALERFINILFYTVTTCVIMSRLNFDPLSLFLSLSSIILAFAFMIGSAASKMCEGWLFILIRRPYGIGDRIHIASPDAPSDPDGSAGWVVKDMTLFHTVAVYGSTNEQATISNGSLASSRVINMARSPNPLIHINLHFSVDTPHEKIVLFENTAREFVKSRPREWRAFESFRVKKITIEGGVVEPWQSIGVVLASKADVTSFCLELTKKLDMRYHSPPLPVDLNMTSGGRRNTEDSGKSQIDAGPKFFSDLSSLIGTNVTE